MSLQTTRDNPDEGYKTQKVRTLDTTVTSVAVDWVTNKVYMSLEMESSARIDVCDMAEDGLCSVLLYKGLDNLHSLVVDPLDGFVVECLRGIISRSMSLFERVKG